MATIGTLLVNLKAETASFHRDMKRAQAETGQFQRSMSRMSKSVIAAGASFLTIEAGARALSGIVRAGMEAEQAHARLQAIIRATGGAAGITAQEMDRLATEMQAATLFDDEELKNAMALMATFRSIQGATFREGIALAADLAATGFGDLKSATVQLGKALEDPVRGISALREVGVTFNQVTVDLVKSLVAESRVLEAQRLILSGVALQVEGAAAALKGNPDSLTSAIDDARDAWDELQEAVAAGPIGDFIARQSRAAVKDLDTMRRSIERLLTWQWVRDLGVTGQSIDRYLTYRPPGSEDLYQLPAATVMAPLQLPAVTVNAPRPSVVDPEIATAAARITQALELERAAIRMTTGELEIHRLMLDGASASAIAYARETQAIARALEEAETAMAGMAPGIERANQAVLGGVSAGIVDPISGTSPESIAQAKREWEQLTEFYVRQNRLFFIPETERVTDDFERAWSRALENVQDGFASTFEAILSREIRNFRDFFASIAALAQRTFAQFAATRAVDFVSGIARSVFGGGASGSVNVSTDGGPLRSPASMGPGPGTGSSSGGISINLSPTFQFHSIDARGTAELFHANRGALVATLVESVRDSRELQRMLARGAS